MPDNIANSSRAGLTVFRLLLWLYPGEFRDEYGREMAIVFSDRYRAAMNPWRRAFILLEAITGILSYAPKEQLHMTIRDLRYAQRALRKNVAFTTTAVLSLAIGIGANTAIFAVAKKVLLENLPVRAPQQLRLLTWVSGHEQPVPSVWGDVYPTEEGGLTSPAFSYPVWRELRKRTEVFQDLVAFKDLEITATANSHAELVQCEMLSGNAFDALGIQTIRGRALTPADDAGPGTPPVAVVSEAFWERFDRSTEILGKTISLNGVPVTVAGVSSSRFTGLTMGSVAQIFIPITLQPLLVPRAQTPGAAGGSLLDNPQAWWISILARLGTSVPEARSQAVLDGVLKQTTHATLPQTKELTQFHLRLEAGDRGLDYLRAFAKPAYILLSLSGLVLLLACVNLANLLLARAATRQREMSTRLALGAGRASILRQMMAESLLLAGLGGFAGVILGYLGRNFIPKLLADPSQPAIGVAISFDWQVVGFTAAISLLTCVAFGAVPAWQAMRIDLNTALKDASRSTMGRRKLMLGRSLVALQIALSTVVLLGAGLFVRTLINLNHVPLGFQADHLLLFKLNPPRTRYTDQRATSLYQALEARFAAIPGVRSVALSNIGLIGDGQSGTSFHISGRPVRHDDGERVQTNSVGTDFFQTMSIPVLQGRTFNSHDNASSPQVAVINRALARQFFPNVNPIGQTFDYDDGRAAIVGIVADTRYADLRSDTPPTFYVPYVQGGIPSHVMVEIRTAGEPLSVLGAVKRAVESIDRDLPLIGVRTQEQQIEASLSSERIFAHLTTGFGLLALILASVGVYGLMAYTVARRTVEIGVRMAVGARMSQVLTGVLREALWTAIAGVGLGIVASFWLTRYVGTMLYGLQATDPLTIAGAAGLLIAIALLAAVGPARSASRVNPLTALRNE